LDEHDAARLKNGPGLPVWGPRTQNLRATRRTRRRGWLTTPVWLVERARALEPQAISSLCGKYLRLVRDFLQQQGLARDRAEDITQGFFEGIVKRAEFRNLDPRVSFGAWLRTGAIHHFYNELDKDKAQKRRLGPQATYELQAQLHDHGGASPERLLDRRRALRLIECAWERLRTEYERQGNERLFDHLKRTLLREGDEVSDALLAESLGYSKSYVGVARHRLRTSELPAALITEFREHRARENASLGPSPSRAPLPIAEEMRALLDALG
jgi:DNA-directed RNA polymerase specialized sigma24 family protein